MFAKLAIIVSILGFGLSCRPQPPAAPRTGAPAPAATVATTRSAVVLERDCGAAGRLIVEMQESRAGPDGRSIHYTFRRLVPPNGTLTEISSTSYGDRTPFGSGIPLLSIIDAGLTADSALVVVYYTRAAVGESGAQGEYSAEVLALEGSGVDVPQSAYQTGLYMPKGDEPMRRVAITGSLKGGDLTLSLVGPHGALRFRFELFRDGRLGWFLLRGNNPPPSYFIAPTLPAGAK